MNTRTITDVNELLEQAIHSFASDISKSGEKIDGNDIMYWEADLFLALKRFVAVYYPERLEQTPLRFMGFIHKEIL